ncbi:MAG: sigma-E factor negative regulatory protein [Saccharospirillum sp.]|nr:sigma-E factor negative regulatory protein [Saccharospirillum sp.]
MTSDQWQERLSAMMDGELSAEEMDALLEQASRDPAIMAQWQRMHQQSASRQNLPDVDVVAAVNHAIDEAAEARSNRSGGASILSFPKRMTGLKWSAMAASFAAVVVLGVNMQSLLGPGDVPVELAAGSSHAYWDLHHQYASFETGMRWQETELLVSEGQP